MRRMLRLTRVVIASVIMATLLIAGSVSVNGQQKSFAAKGKEFKDVVKYIETQFGAKKTRIPMFWLASFAVKLIRPAGVKGIKLAVFEDINFTSHPAALSFDTVMRDAYRKDWQPIIRVNSKRGGNAQTHIYARNAGKDVQFAIVTFEEREAVVMEVKFNPDAAARFLDDPKIMGISIGNSVRGGSPNIANVGSIMTKPPTSQSRSVNSSSPDNLDSLNAVVDEKPDQTASTIERPKLANRENDSTNPPLPAEPENKPALPSVNADVSAISSDAKLTVESVKPESDRDTIRIETRLVNLNVKAIDKTGQPLTSLSKDDFEVYEDGVKQPVTHFRPVNAPVNLILMLDLSGSTKKSRDGMISAARKFIDTLPPQDKISLVAFTRKYKILSDFTTNKSLLKNSVERIKKISGGTAFYDSMWEALDNLDQISDARKAIVVLTDGEDESIHNNEETNHDFNELLERASEEDVTIYPIYFSTRNHYNRLGVLFGGSWVSDLQDLQKVAQRQLDLLAEHTGGEVINTRSQEDLDEAYKRVASEIHTLYSLAYSPDKLAHNGEFRKIAVKVKREGAIGRTRRGYYDR